MKKNRIINYFILILLISVGIIIFTWFRNAKIIEYDSLEEEWFKVKLKPLTIKENTFIMKDSLLLHYANLEAILPRIDTIKVVKNEHACTYTFSDKSQISIYKIEPYTIENARAEIKGNFSEFYNSGLDNDFEFQRLIFSTTSEDVKIFGMSKINRYKLMLLYFKKYSIARGSAGIYELLSEQFKGFQFCDFNNCRIVSVRIYTKDNLSYEMSFENFKEINKEYVLNSIKILSDK